MKNRNTHTNVRWNLLVSFSSRNGFEKTLCSRFLSLRAILRKLVFASLTILERHNCFKNFLPIMAPSRVHGSYFIWSFIHQKSGWYNLFLWHVWLGDVFMAWSSLWLRGRVHIKDQVIKLEPPCEWIEKLQIKGAVKLLLKNSSC